MKSATQLAEDWLAAKVAEQAAIDSRIAIELQLAAALGTPSEGSKTHAVDGFKITITQPLYRKIDPEVWPTVAHLCPRDLHPTKLKIEADASGIKWLLDNKPNIWRKIAAAFTTTVGKINVKVERK